MQDTVLRVSLAQYDIVWENKQANLSKIKDIVASLAGQTDIVVLPEMCTTGFSMRSHELAETTSEETITYIKQYASQYDIAICGSFIAKENGDYFNRAFFISASSEYYYDKRHLFRMGQEADFFSSGEKRLIFEHKGFNICLLVCYDLRFPVWARNVNNEYDLLIYVANWPASRIKVWNTLLDARAIENMCYVCGVNRIGIDGNGLKHDGSSKLINAKGEILTSIPLNQEQIETVSISKEDIDKFRAKFPVWKDADKFKIE
ncbi:amidohydrolase [Dysgonomonas sp. ZJ279]|uniref:amidohydrolase n=1 Tax=Dysgonomonas sp. ZJ279 TaxID=2709796 RepID=UPI0013EBDC8C|nr:amidohydrolase [Dysgonomonas sp. ZJ279]